jgi:protein involved in polysaccharide export with SLBB domain
MNIPLQPYDELVIRRIPNWLEETERYVTLRGEVMFPGTYPIFKGERLSDAIRRAGGYTDKAYLFGAKFTRRSVQKLQQERMDEAITRMEKDIAIKEQGMAAAVSTKEDAAATKLALDGLKRSIEKLKAARAEGRIAMRLEPLEELKKSPYDLELMGGDALEIPQSPMAVAVLGEVASPTTIIWIPERDVSFYLAMAGGPTGNAETGEMYVIMANGMVRGKQSDGMFGGFMSTKLHPGDAVIVPQIYERISWMKEIKDIAQILANIAVTAGVPLAILNR